MNTELQEAIPHRPEADAFDPRKSWERIKLAVRGHTRLIAYTCLCSVAVVALYIIVWPPIYQAQVSIIADSKDDRQREEFYSYWNTFRKNSLPDEVAMMTSRSVLGGVVDKLGLTYDDVYHPFLSHLAYLWETSWVGRAYRKVKYFFFPRPNSPYRATPQQIERARILRDFKEGVALVPIPGTDAGSLVVQGPSPRVAQIANTLIDTYLEQRQQSFIAEAQAAHDSLAQVVGQAKAELDAIEAKIKEYDTKNTMLLALEKDRVEVSQWLEKRAQVVELEAMLASTQRTLSEVDRQLGEEHSEIVSSRVYARNPVKSSLEEHLSQLELELAALKLKFQPDSPEVADVQRQIDSLKKMISSEADNQEQQRSFALSTNYEELRQRRNLLASEVEGTRARLAVERQADAKLEQRVTATPERMNVSQDMAREREVAQKKYMALQDKLMVSAVSLGTIRSAPPALRVVARAFPPDSPEWPKTKLFLAAALALGAVLGTLLALMLDLVWRPVSRHNIPMLQTGGIYAIVSVDSEFLAQLYSLPASAKNRLPNKF